MPTSPDPLWLGSLLLALLGFVLAARRANRAERERDEAHRYWAAEIKRNEAAEKEVADLSDSIKSKDAELNRLSRAEIKANAGASVARVRLSGTRDLVNTLATELWEAGINPMALPGYREYAEGEQRRRDREADEAGGPEGSSGDPISLGLPADMVTMADMATTGETATPVLPAAQVGQASDSGEPPWLVVMQAMGRREAVRVARQGMKLGEN